MNILVVGQGPKPVGSWIMRGIQLGAALGARVVQTPTPEDWRWASLAILVKNHALPLVAQAQAAGVPIIWDALDFWRQPAENRWTEAQARQGLAAALRVMRPVLTIGATRAQAEAAAGRYLVHHSRGGLVPTEARATVTTVGYDGSPSYLGRWHGWLASACHRRGWSFVMNPQDLAAMDLLVAFRDGVFDGWPCREWKSGVKLVNAIAAGRPILSQPSAAWAELTPMGSILSTVAELDAALDEWTPYPMRRAVVESSKTRAEMFHVEHVAADYRAIIGAYARHEVQP
jgi:hypothetical protein